MVPERTLPLRRDSCLLFLALGLATVGCLRYSKAEVCRDDCLRYSKADVNAKRFPQAVPVGYVWGRCTVFVRYGGSPEARRRCLP
jgi:hypothetical protein